MSMWLPPKVSRELQEETRASNAATLSMFNFDAPGMKQWNRELQKIDPALRLGRAKEQAQAMGVYPNYYHLVRMGQHLWVMPLHDGRGGFVEPTSAMLDMLRGSDMQNPQVMRAHKKLQENLAKEEEFQRERDHERRSYELLERWKAVSQVRIPFNTDIRWSQNVAGRKGRV